MEPDGGQPLQRRRHLQRYADPDTDSHADSNTYADTNPYSNAHPGTDAYSDANADPWSGMLHRVGFQHALQRRGNSQLQRRELHGSLLD
jgi:hypothetical protein